MENEAKESAMEKSDNAAVAAVAEKSATEQTVAVETKDVRQLLAEIREKQGELSEANFKKLVAATVAEVQKTASSAKDESVRKGEFHDDADPGKNFSKSGKLSGKFTFKHAITGNAPRRFMRKYEGELKELHDMNDEILIVSKVLGKHPRELGMYKEYEEAARDFASKALVSTTAGSGDEFVPTNFSAQLIDKTRLSLKVAALHDRIPMRSNPYTVPLEGADATAVLASEATVEATEAGRITASTPGTSNVTFTAQKLAVRTVFSEEINEDSIVGIMDFVRGKISLALANGVENATINGDTTATHQDADVTSSTDVRKAWKGYRKLTAPAGFVDAGGDALTAIDMRNARKAMGKYGINPAELAWVVGVNTMHQMLSVSDANGFNDFRTLEKIGSSAQVLTGMIGLFDGIPVVVSEFVRENVGANGVYDGTNVGRTNINLVNRTRFWYGDRRLITLKTFEDIQTDQIVMVVKQRLDFQPVEASTNTLVATVIDILVS